jgi:glycosyltransferase involved in cell wall biosynthesis
LRILVDAHMIGSRETGNETYVANLVRSVSGLPGVTCGAAVAAADEIPPHSLGHATLVPLRTWNNWLRLVYALPAASRKWQADILHVTYVGPFFSPCPLVVSVHDVSFRRYPAFFSPRDRLLFATLLPWTLRKASAVLTLSEHARQEIVELYPYVKNKTYVTLLAPSSLFHPLDQEESLAFVRRQYGLASEFVLAVGNLQPRKNLLRLVKAFAAVCRQRPEAQLAIVGKAQWQSSAIYKAVQDLGLERSVIFTGYVPDDMLVQLYNAAKLFVYPSIYEGFGLPILEAMACGTPVITSTTSSMPEVAGQAALLVDPYLEEQMAQAISKVLDDVGLASSLSRAGLHRAQQFSWDRTAKQTLEAYRAVLESKRSS